MQNTEKRFELLAALLGDRVKPRISYEVILNLIAPTLTDKDLTVYCELDENSYPKGIKVPDKELAKITTERGADHRERNHKI